MQNLPKSAGGWVVTAIGLVVVGVLVRIGWELGGRVWGLF